MTRMRFGKVGLVAMGMFLVLATTAVSAVRSDAQSSDLIAFLSDRAGGGDLYVLDPAVPKIRRLTFRAAIRRGNFSPLSTLYVDPPVWAPDGSALLFVNRDGDRPALHVVGVGGRGGRRLAVNAECACWSPDGLSIAFTRSRGSGHDLWLIRADGTALRRLARNGACPRWSPDGTSIAFTGRDGVELVDQAGTARRPLVQGGFATGWSPDSKDVLFVRQRDDTVDIYIVGTGDAVERLLAQDASWPAWSPNGDHIAYVGSRSLGPPPSSDAFDIAVVRSDGTEQQWLTRNSSTESLPTWSPDGTQVAFSSDMTFTREWRSGDEVFVVGVDGSRLRRLTRNKAYDIYPVWSPAR